MSDSQDRVHELISAIPVLRNVVTTLPRASPLRIRGIQVLAVALEARYYLSRQEDDLEQSILNYTEAIFLPPNRPCPNIAEYFFATARLLPHRAVNSKQPADIKYAVIYLRYLRGLLPEALHTSPDWVTERLVHALALQVESEPGDMMQDIEEMAVLVLELLNSDTWTYSTDTIIFFAKAITRPGNWGKGKEPPAKVIDCLRKARVRLPDSDQLSITLVLARTLFDRFRITYSNNDYEEGTAILDKILTDLASHPHGDETSQYQVALHLIFMFAQVQSAAYGRPEHLEEAMYLLRNKLHRTPLEDPDRPYLVAHLNHLQSRRFEDFGVGGLQEGHSYDSLPSDLPPFRDLISSIESSSMEAENQLLYVLRSILRMTDVTEIENAIEPCRRLVASFHSNNMLKYLAAGTLGELLSRAFSLTDKVEYLNEAISMLREALNLPDAERFGAVLGLIFVLYSRFKLRPSREDLDEIMQLYQMVINRRGTRIPERFQLSCQWAQLARIHNHPSTSTAYDYALSSMQYSLTFAPTVDTQHYRLVARRGDYETLPLDCASYRVHTGHLQSAIETLERGRALIWSEMRGLRSSIDQLRASDSDLADKLDTINQYLEVLTLASAQNNYDDGGEGGLEEMDPFGRLVLRQQALLDGRDKLILQIRARKGLESFLKPPSFDNLRSAAARGPVIMINHCKWRSDIIILPRDSPPSLIPTAIDFYDRANKLRDHLLGARNKGLDSFEYDDALRSVLKKLYELVGRPVIQRLNELRVPAQSRVWWCPTSAFCSLPLHAMGPIPSDSGPPQYFLDLYIPSYTPTLSALIESNKSGPQTLGKPSLLLVGQPDENMKAAWGEMRVVQSVNTQVKTLVSARATPTAVRKRLQDHGFVHIVCHGILEPGKPFDSSFKLYRGNRLTLMDIIRSRLPNAEFAFLAACHTAELTDGSLSDEALHLAAAMQYCGFRSVVGTMWAMADTDGRHLAQSFYESVFPVGESLRVCYYERTAEALRDAVINLRSRTSLERWVNFVHYGA